MGKNRKLSVLIEQIQRKFSSTEAKSLLGIFVLFGIIVFVWLKVEAAKQRARDRARGRRNNANNNNNNQAQQQRRTLQNSRDEMKTLSAKERYLHRKSWENQCICICLEQCINRNEVNNSVTFKNGICELLKSLAQRHRLYLIHLLPQSIIDTLDTDKPYEQSKYEKDVIELFETNNILETHKILFCTTEKGKSSMVRQLMPTLYIGYQQKVLEELHQHIAECVQVTSLFGAGGVAPTVLLTKSVLSYFS